MLSGSGTLSNPPVQTDATKWKKVGMIDTKIQAPGAINITREKSCHIA